METKKGECYRIGYMQGCNDERERIVKEIIEMKLDTLDGGTYIEKANWVRFDIIRQLKEKQ